jgi:hypothetical protein
LPRIWPIRPSSQDTLRIQKVHDASPIRRCSATPFVVGSAVCALIGMGVWLEMQRSPTRNQFGSGWYAPRSLVEPPVGAPWYLPSLQT